MYSRNTEQLQSIKYGNVSLSSSTCSVGFMTNFALSSFLVITEQSEWKMRQEMQQGDVVA